MTGRSPSDSMSADSMFAGSMSNHSMSGGSTFTGSMSAGPAPLRRAHPGVPVQRPPEVLFVCVHNAGRSQMGAALLDQHSRGRVQARSAGPAPAAGLHLPVVAAMAEVGIDLSGACPTRLTDDAVRAASVVITMGCGDTVPIYPHTRYLTWELDDPAEKVLEDIRPIRDEIDSRVRSLLYSLGVAARVGLLRDRPDPDRLDLDESGHDQSDHDQSGGDRSGHDQSGGDRSGLDLPDRDQPDRGEYQPPGSLTGARRLPTVSPRPRPYRIASAGQPTSPDPDRTTPRISRPAPRRRGPGSPATSPGTPPGRPAT
jgi:protein-tyrosine-phosphatase